MKLSLEEAQDKRKLNRTISLIKAQIEYILWLLSNTTSNAGTVISTGSGGTGNVPVVSSLPPIPTVYGSYQMVFWTSSAGGTGDDQPWWTYYGYSRWYPSKFSTLSGAPGEVEIP